MPTNAAQGAADSAPVYADLIRQAFEAREGAYVPYSGFMVGAALLTKSGKVYTGGNIENAAYTPSNCAERTAFFKAVSEGERKFAAIAVVGGMKGTTAESFAWCFPCGVCRQIMAEFCGDDFVVLVAKSPEEYRQYSFGELFPEPFGPKDLDQV